MISGTVIRSGFRLVALIAAICIISIPLADPVFAGNTPGPSKSKSINPSDDTPPPPLAFYKGQVVAKLKAGSFSPDALADQVGASVVAYLPSINACLLQLDTGADPDSAARSLDSLSEVEDSHPNYLVNSLQPVQGSYPFPDIEGIGSYHQQLAVTTLDLTGAHGLATGAGVTVGVIDGGIDYLHPEFNGTAVSGYDFVDGDADAFDEPGGRNSGHGTFAAGIVHLVAPNADIRAYRITDEIGAGDGFSMACAIDRAVSDGCEVINLSVVLLHEHSAVHDAISYAVSQGVAVVVAAGNEASETPIYPAAYDEAIGVAAIDSQMVLADFCSYGSHIDVCAPGIDVYSTYQDDGFAWWSGTSFSTPFVTGQIALLAEVSPMATPTMVRYALSNTADNIDYLNPDRAGQLGSGLIDPVASLNEIATMETASVTPDTLTFTFQAGGVIPAALIPLTGTVYLSSSNAPAAYTAKVIDQLVVFTDLADTAGVTDDSVLVLVQDHYSLPVGSHYNTVVFNVDGVMDPVLLTVCVEMLPAPDPAAGIIPSTLSFTAELGSETLLYGSAFLSSSNAPASFTGQVLAGGDQFTTLLDTQGMTNDSVTVAVDPSLMFSVGLYKDTVEFQVEGVADPVLLEVLLDLVDPGAGDDTAFVVPELLEFEAPPGSTDTLAGAVVLSSSNAPAAYSGYVLGGPSSFVSLPDSTGMTPDSVLVLVNLTGLDIGTYGDTVVFDVSGVADPVLLTVILQVTDSGDPPGDSAYVWPASSFFTAPAGSTVVFSSELYVSSTNAPAGFSAWILDEADVTVLLDSAGTTNDTIHFEVHSTSSLAPGLYIDTIIVDVAGVVNSPLISVVYLTVETGGGGDDTAFVIPELLTFEAPAGSTDTLAGVVLLSSSNAPAAYSGFVLGDLSSFVYLPDSVGMTDDSVLVMVAPEGRGAGVYLDTVVFDVVGVSDPVLLFVRLTLGADSSVAVALQNFPNPFNPATNIMVALPRPSQTLLEVYNVLGQRVATLIDCHLPAGTHQVIWEGTDDTGRKVGSGVYFYRLQAGSIVETRKMMLLK